MSDTLEMSVSSVTNTDGKKHIYVWFCDKNRNAEGRIPECDIIKNNGFSEKELAALRFYMKENTDQILKAAKTVSLMQAFMGKSPEKNNSLSSKNPKRETENFNI